jgi:hypothetical protein
VIDAVLHAQLDDIRPSLAADVCWGLAFSHGPEPPRTGTRARRSTAAAEAKRAEVERNAIAEAEKIVATWNARQAGPRSFS